MFQKKFRQLIKYVILMPLFATVIFLLFPAPVNAMHIAEGILPASWAAIWYAIAVIFVGIGIYLIKKKTTGNKGLIPLLGLAGAAITNQALQSGLGNYMTYQAYNQQPGYGGYDPRLSTEAGTLY